jgi:hypothetical protein
MPKTHQNHAQALPRDRYADDPFFRRHPNSTWNACVGEQGDEEYYLDGYIDAAIELAAAVIDKKMFGKRDTLVLPILYNARHAVELVLKFATGRLVEAGLIPRAGRPNHDISEYWGRLHVAALGDEKLNKQIHALKPFVDSLSRIDSDGQELRYHLNRFDDPSLEDFSLVNLEVVRTSLSELSKIISVLKNRVIGFTEERRSGLFTKRCSRRDLLTIAQTIPRRESWNNALFDIQKAAVMARFNLTNREFSDALNVIQSSRETKSIIGVETDLLQISDDEIIWVIERWRRIHPAREEVSRVHGWEDFDEAWIQAMKKEMATRNDVISEIELRITGDKLAEIEAIVHLGRDGIFPEYYEAFVEEKKKEHAVENDAKSKIAYLMDKTNFRQSVHIAAPKLGRLSLASRLATL